MRIKTRIKLGIILSFILAATIALLLFLGARAVNEASRLEGKAVEVIKGLAEMKIVTHEYILHPEERSLMQWRTRYGSLSNLLTGVHFKNPDEKIAADQIFKNLERFKTVFFALITGLRKGATPGNQESAAFRELQDRLMDELLMKSRLVVSLAFQMQQKIEAKLMTTQERVAFLTLLLLLTLIAVIIGISLWVNRSIARPIAKLEKDTRIIGSGNLDHKVGTTVKDEIGQLSRAFDKMTQDLKETTTSIVELNKEIDERKRAEEALRESEAVFQAAMDQSQAGIAIADAPDGKLRYVNKSALGIRGKTKEEIVNGIGIEQYVASWQILHFDGTPYKDDEVPLARAIMYGEVCSKELIVRRPDEEDRIVLANAAPIFNDKGEVFAGIVVFLDVTGRKHTEEALRDVERRNQALLDHSPVCHKIVGLDFNLAYMSANGFKMLQLDDNADVYGKPYPFEFFPAAFRNEMTENLKKVKETGDMITMEALANDIEGNKVWLDSTLLPVLDDDGRIDYITVVSANTTQRKLADEEKAELESQLHRAQKMEAMGLMAGGVAHDLNNILSGIVSYPELLLMDLPEGSPMWKPIKTIQESGMRAADVVEDLLTIARGVATGKEALDLNILITEYLGSAEYQKLDKTHSFVSCRTELDPDLLNMSGSPVHIKKIVMNLVANATEAIEGSGTVTISTTSQYLDEPLKGYEDVHIGEYVVLTISDDGSGISPGDLERIFEPFYTKKMMGRSGTGLGLTVVWNCMQDHNGYINVNSSERGTVFELYFPVTREEVAAEGEEVPLDDYLGHGEKILVVDDEERQREIASVILKRLGYNPESVASGEEAIEYVKEQPVDLIVLDMVMPKGINGRKTYEEIIKIRPGQKAIIASGYSKTKEVDKAQELGAGKYIKKPYTLPKVGLAVKGELEK